MAHRQPSVLGLYALTALLALAPSASAQTLNGRVVDAESGLGIAGAIVAALTSDDVVRARTLTREDGEFSLRPPVEFDLSALRVERIGYEPQTFPVADSP